MRLLRQVKSLLLESGLRRLDHSLDMTQISLILLNDDGLTSGAAVLSAADAGVDPFGVPQMMTSDDRDSSSMREARGG